MYSDNVAHAMPGANPMQYMFAGFATSQMHQQQQHPAVPQMQGHSASVITHAIAPSPPSEYPQGQDPVGPASYLLQRRQAPMAGPTSSSISQGSSSANSGGSTSMAGISASGPLGFFSSTARRPGSTLLPQMFTGNQPWPGWDNTASPASIGMAATTLPETPPKFPRTTAPTTNHITAVTGAEGSANRVVIWEESRRTRQQKLQKLAKNAFKTKGGEWPMKIPTTEDRQIGEGYRVFVHKVFRATARRFLDVAVISFKEHPVKDVENMKEILEAQFVFEPPLEEGYILWNIEDSMRTCRYQ